MPGIFLGFGDIDVRQVADMRGIGKLGEHDHAALRKAEKSGRIKVDANIEG